MNWGRLLVTLGLVGLAVAIRDPRYVLTRSFWLDEGWVVDSVRAPLHQLELLTSSTPIGWTLLLRLVPPEMEGRAAATARLVPP